MDLISDTESRAVSLKIDEKKIGLKIRKLSSVDFVNVLFLAATRLELSRDVTKREQIGLRSDIN